MRRLRGYPLRGAIGFGLGLCMMAAAIEYGATSWLLNLGAPFFGGMIGAALFMSAGRFEARALVGFGCSFVLMWFAVLFTHVSIQGGGRPDLGWGAMGCAVGFAVGGGLGALTIRPGLFLPGAMAFGLAGALGGAVSFHLIDIGVTRGGMMPAMGGAGSVAGFLFGLAVELLGD